ncbi:MAG: aldo/keto reductase [Syntrophobacterales bacterium]|jgi:aryl-alcohol dehydrogenase-like predicted oxidoreductase|nr:aldo/keto reductase [Syntrophobacterales bacterium]
MEYTQIPGTDLKVSRISLGTWAIGGWMWGGTDEEESIRTIDAAIDQGVNLIDTAPVYGFGRSEQIVGKALARSGKRDQVVISTKTGLDWKDGKVFRNCSPAYLRKNFAASLKNLQTDYVDILYIHWPDPLEPFAETARVMNEFLKEGRIKAVGVSNYSPEQITAFQQGGPVHIVQPPYNLFERAIEADLMPFCHQHNIHLMTYGALCRGLLSGHMTPGRTFTGDDLRNYDPKFKQPRLDQYLAAVKQLDAMAWERFDHRVLHLAVRWVLDHGSHIALWGARRPDQMDPVPEIMGWHLDQPALHAIDAILQETVKEPVGPEFMAPPPRKQG